MRRVFVSDNGGPFTPWQTATTDTSATYDGVAGHTYAFFSEALDNVGYIQASPKTAGVATTRVVAPPTSSVNPLPAITRTPSFTVSWSGTPGAGADSIASYDIFVATDGGPFVPFLTGTTATSATYPGQNGHTYGFYSVATDNVGHREATPSQAEATTTVQTQAATTTALVSDYPSGSVYGQAVTFTATVSAAGAGAGTPTGSVQFQIDGTAFGSAETLGDGTASITTAALSAGTHRIVAFYTSDSGNFSSSDNSAVPLSQTVTPALSNIAAPAPPVLTGPASGVVNATTLTLTGTAVPGSTVRVYDGGTLLPGGATASDPGTWSYTTPLLAEGAHSFTATATVGDNTSAASAPLLITVDRTAPAPPTLTGPTAIHTTSLPLSGTAEGNSTVTVYDSSSLLGSTTASATGTWSFLFTGLTGGGHGFTATARVSRKQSSRKSSPFSDLRLVSQGG